MNDKDWYASLTLKKKNKLKKSFCKRFDYSPDDLPEVANFTNRLRAHYRDCLSLSPIELITLVCIIIFVLYVFW